MQQRTAIPKQECAKPAEPCRVRARFSETTVRTAAHSATLLDSLRLNRQSFVAPDSISPSSSACSDAVQCADRVCCVHVNRSVTQPLQCSPSHLGCATLPLGGHLNPTIEGHFKTDQRRKRISALPHALLRAIGAVLAVAANHKKNKGHREGIDSTERTH